MISPRYVPAACALLLVALVPTFIHSYANVVHDDGRRTQAIPPVLAGFESVASDRNEGWGRRRFDTDDWVEREYAAGSERVRLTVVRTYDAKSVYHHPELAVAYGHSFVGQETRRFAERADVPVHVLKPAPGTTGGAFYVLQYDDRFVEDPIRFQIRTAGEMLFSPRKPMTLFFVLDQDAKGSGKVQQPAAARVLFAALDAFLKAPAAR